MVEDKDDKPASQAGELASKPAGIASKLPWFSGNPEISDFNIEMRKHHAAPKALDQARATAIDYFIFGVQKKLANCTVYFDFEFKIGSFSASVLSFVQIDQAWYYSNYVTSYISYGLNEADMNREISNVARAISAELGQRVFARSAKPIPDNLLKIIRRVG